MADLIHILNIVSPTHSIEDVSVVWASKRAMRSEYTINLLADYPKLRNIRFTVIDINEWKERFNGYDSSRMENYQGRKKSGRYFPVVCNNYSTIRASAYSYIGLKYIYTLSGVSLHRDKCTHYRIKMARFKRQMKTYKMHF